jgi:rhodanese-related sulfurtransferase
VRPLRAVVLAAVVAVGGCAGNGGELRPAPPTSSTASTAPVIEAPPAVIAPLDAQVLLDSGDARAIDVRSSDEFAVGHLPGAELYDVAQEGFASAVNGLPRDATFVVYSNTTDLSAEAVSIMTGLGFLDVRQLDGGFDAWVALGLPVQT